MSNVDIIRAWKDEAYRLSLSDEERAALPENPAGMIELTDLDLAEVAGGNYIEPTDAHSCIGSCSSSCRNTNCGCNGFISATSCVELPIRPILYLP